MRHATRPPIEAQLLDASLGQLDAVVMDLALRGHHWLCVVLIRLSLRLAVALDNHRRRLPRWMQRLRGSVRRLYQRWLARNALPSSAFPGRRHSWNRTPAHREEEVVRLHVEHPQLGAGQLRRIAARVLGFEASRETFRRILKRRRDLVCALQLERQRRPRRIRVAGPLKLWGMDLTLVWVLGFFPVWLLGVVDYHGSRVVLLERVRRPSAAEIARALEAAFTRDGVPERILTDRGPVFRSEVFEAFLQARGVCHTLTRPAHPWTNGRVERLFRLFKETVFARIWLFASVRQVERFCADFVQWHNRDRPHGSWDGRTPYGRPFQRRPLGRVTYFDGHLAWYRFGH